MTLFLRLDNNITKGGDVWRTYAERTIFPGMGMEFA
jgi:hypothetical protein